MKDQIVIRDSGTTYYLSGREVAREEYEKLYPPFVPDERPLKAKGKVDPWRLHKSEGAAVHPDQRQEAMESAAKKGVPTYFDRHGRPKFTSANHQRSYLRAYGLHNRDDNA